MWDQIFTLALGNGLWAALFCLLFFNHLKDSKKREEKYIETIKMLGHKLDIVTRIKEDTGKILISFPRKKEDKPAVLTAAPEKLKGV